MVWCLLRKITEGGFRASFFVAFWLVLTPFSSANAHFSDYIFVRFSLDEQRNLVGLDVWLDYRENPFIDTREEAHAILEEELIWQLGKEDTILLTLPDLLPDDFIWREVSRLPEDCPAPPAEEGEQHQFLHASADFLERSPVSGAISLLIPTESSQAAIVWLMDRESLRSDSLSFSSAEEVMMLLAGDFTPFFLVEETGRGKLGWLIAGAVAGGIICWLAFRRFVRRRSLHANQ